MKFVDINLDIPIQTQTESIENNNADSMSCNNTVIENSIGTKSIMTLKSAPISYSTYMQAQAYIRANMYESVLIYDDFFSGNKYMKCSIACERIYGNGSNKMCILDITLKEV